MEPIHINCPTCGQHIEINPAPSGGGLKKAVEITILAALIALTGFVVHWKLQTRAEAAAKQQAFIRDINPEKFEDTYQTHRRLESEAEAAQLKACSNWLGFNRIIDHYILASDAAVSNWTGRATVDFVNKNGGMERTNLLFQFWEFDHHCIGDVATWKMR
jgi:hypothetical protein